MIAMVLVAGAAAYWINDAGNALQQVSTPAGTVDSASLGGEAGTPIDTGPAQTFVAKQSEDTSSGNSLPAETPTASGSPEATTVPVAEVEQGVEVFLLMGVDAREGESIDIGVRPDSLAVAMYDQDSGDCRLLSIPRDSRVMLPGYGLSKINHALAIGGIPYEIAVVEAFLGVEIDHYGLIDFAGVVTIVDAIGGIDITVPETLTIGEKEFPAGLQHLNGKDALLYARYRGGPDGDFGRIRRQQQVISAAMAQLSSESLVRLIPEVLPRLDDHVRTDLDVGDLATLGADVLRDCSGAAVDARSLEGEIATYPDPIIGLDLSYVEVDEADRAAKVKWLLTGEAPPVSGSPDPAREGTLPAGLAMAVPERHGWRAMVRTRTCSRQ
jgi:LCP family protein required for cell wall assembly